MSGRPQMTAMNGKRPSSIPPRHQAESTSQHLDLIKYICDSWNTVSRELDTCNTSNYRNGAATVTYYQEREPNPQLKDLVGSTCYAKHHEKCKLLVSGPAIRPQPNILSQAQKAKKIDDLDFVS